MARPPSCNIHRVARQCGVILRDAHEHSPTSIRPRHCFCKRTVKAIGDERGEAHLALVLRLIVESDGNAAELHAATLKAVSSVVGSEMIVANGALFEAFDRVDLRTLRLWAQAARGVGSTASVADTMAAALLWQIASPQHLQQQLREAA